MAKRIVIVPYDARWPLIYEGEAAAIRAALGDQLVAIEHIGSTAVPGLGAKPIVDIMAGVPSLIDADRCIRLVEPIGWQFQPEALDDMPDDRYFELWRNGVEVAHLHLTEYNSPFWFRHVAFRDILRNQPETARRYESLKRELAPRFSSGAEYAGAKSEFVADAMRSFEEAIRAHTGSLAGPGFSLQQFLDERLDDDSRREQALGS